MEVFILDPVVRQNVRLLMHIIQDALKQSEGDVKKAERVYSLMVNRKTGEFQEVNERRLSGDWKKIVIKIPGQAQARCEVVDPFKPEVFVFSDLHHAALVSLLKTVHIMDQLVYPDAGDSKDPMMSLIHCIIDTEKETRSFPLLLLDAWHPVSREEAERLLEKSPNKTFLFRQDVYAKILERELNDLHGMHVRCFTLTYKESKGKITDQMLIEHKGLWTIYQDDPEALLENVTSFEEVLSSLKDALDKPLLN